MTEEEVTEMFRLRKAIKDADINYKDLLGYIISSYITAPLTFDKRKDKVVYKVDNNIYLEIGNYIMKNSNPNGYELTDNDYKRFFFGLLGHLFDEHLK